MRWSSRSPVRSRYWEDRGPKTGLASARPTCATTLSSPTAMPQTTALAPAVQRALQTLARPWNRRRALEVFRDETGLAVSPATVDQYLPRAGRVGALRLVGLSGGRDVHLGQPGDRPVVDHALHRPSASGADGRRVVLECRARRLRRGQLDSGAGCPPGGGSPRSPVTWICAGHGRRPSSISDTAGSESPWPSWPLPCTT